jgi:hypothetical protein
MTRAKAIVAALAITAAVSLRGIPAEAADVTVYRSPTCGCCEDWAEHLRANGFTVVVKDVEDMGEVKRRFSVPAPLQSCHTAMVDGYAVEGHVPASDIRRLLAERPKATGLAVPGMPIGSPGMEQGSQREPYSTILFGPADQSVYARH